MTAKPCEKLAPLRYVPPVGVSPKLGTVIVRGFMLAAALRRFIQEEQARGKRGAHA